MTIVDVAARAGVAISTASVALNDRPGVSEATRQRIREVADELGFIPSVRGKSLSARRAFALGLVVQRDTAVLEADPFFGAFLGGVESILTGRDYALVLQMAMESADALQRYRRLASDRRVDGVFLLDIRTDDARVPLLQDLHLPAVGMNAPDGFPFPSVRQDHAAGIASLVNYLIGVGHTRIAHVTGAPGFIHTEQREAAWRESLAAAGLEPGPALPGDFTYEGGRRAADRLLGVADRPTAVICANDLTAIGLMTRVQELGLSVPDDISVAGYDGIELGSYLRPTLTTVRTAPAEIGAEAARLLLDAIDGAGVSDVDVAAAALQLRESTGPAPRLTARTPRT
ncbi:MAG TPA: LacI family DNA-binding transcriptional regulator [Gaiellaceae bacterium]|nr:LacI family DNA-binding transcriptional regulator [Gaiellaceae bacterium]